MAETTENTGPEIWQVEVNGTIYEAPFDEMAEWIAEGSLLPGDKVRKGNLRWIEAGKVPPLIRYFNAKDSGQTLTTPESAVPDAPQISNFHPVAEPAPEPPVKPANLDGVIPPRASGPPPAAGNTPAQVVCAVHADIQAVYECSTCASAFCKACPNSYGGSVKICPFCGAMCNSIDSVKTAEQVRYRHDTALSEGFGIADFGRALVYPFKFKFSLVVGAIMFTIFSFGQAASGIGGFVMMGSALFCSMGANMLAFAVLSNTIDNFSQGRIGENFMPRFDGFSFWEDVLHPFFLNLGVSIVSFGLLIALLIGSIWYFANVTSSASTALQDRSVQMIMPGSEGDLNAARQVPRINELREQLNKDNPYANGEIPDEDEIVRRQTGGVRDTEEDVMKTQALIEQAQRSQTESVVGKTADEERAIFGEMAGDMARGAGIFGLLMIAATLWGLFYLPAASVVAGYTRSFTAVINPSVGLDTIKRLGSSYVKILLMCAVLACLLIASNIVLMAVFSAFDLPRVGNLPATVIQSFINFYLIIVYSCILGFALYKKSDKLNLLRA